MPRIAEFSGVVIQMFHRDHQPPHFHVSYGEYEALIGIDNIHIIGGRLRMRIRRLVLDWAAIHQQELIANWDSVRRMDVPARIGPPP